MPTDEQHLSRSRPQHDGLASYRRLIELQKQMIILSQQHEQSKRECAALRELVTRELADQLRARRTLRERMQRSASELFKRVPGFGSSETKLSTFNNKQVSSC
jgi:hypothetical protein